MDPTETWALPASTIKPSPLPMIWRGRIPVGALTVIAGKPGLGKSTLATTIAADISADGLTAIISDLEDDLAGVVRPRLEVGGAMLERVHLIPPEAAPVLPADLSRLYGLITQTKASCLLLDPIGAHFRPERRVHDRPTLRELVQLARDTRCAIIGVHHTVKSSIDGTALGAIGGPSGGLAGTARAVYVYGYDPNDEDRRALACAKINGVEEPPTMIFEHDTVELDYGPDLGAGALRFVGESDAHAKDALKRGKSRTERDGECGEWLTKFLADGEEGKRQVSEVKREGTGIGFAWATLRRVAVGLQIERQKVGFGSDGFWTWGLPADHPLRNPDGQAQEP
jgi:hypothetical protein